MNSESNFKVNLIHKLYKKGLSQRKIAKVVHTSLSVVNKYLKDPKFNQYRETNKHKGRINMGIFNHHKRNQQLQKNQVNQNSNNQPINQNLLNKLNRIHIDKLNYKDLTMLINSKDPTYVKYVNQNMDSLMAQLGNLRRNDVARAEAPRKPSNNIFAKLFRKYF